MRKTYIIILLSLLATGLSAAKYAGDIFQLSPGVLNAAMGNTGLSFRGSPAAGWWNPALLVEERGNGAELMRVEHFKGLLQQNQFSLILGGKLNSSLSVNHLAIDRIKLTRLENPADSLSNENRPIVWKTVTNNDLIITAGMARRLSERFSLGLSPKLAYRNLAENSGYGFGADLGLIFDAGKGLTAGANLRDFFSTQILWENGTHEAANPNLDLELGYGFKPLNKEIPVQLAVRGQIFADGRGDASALEAGLLSANLHAGLMVSPIPELLVMGGWDADSFTAGLGVRWQGLGLDYAWRNGSPDALGSSQRLSLSYRW
jgi:hypothetical protein